MTPFRLTCPPFKRTTAQRASQHAGRDEEVQHRALRPCARGFGTRYTLSSQTDPNRGVGAARDWIYDQMQQFASRSDGRMTVEKQSYVQQPDGNRSPTPTTITNVVATLRGTQNPDRTYVVSGHYDSRCTDPNSYVVKGITKDNFMFGVRAVDTDGNRSPVAFPRPVP